MQIFLFFIMVFEIYSLPPSREIARLIGFQSFVDWHEIRFTLFCRGRLVHTIMFNIAFVKHWNWCLIQMFHHFFGLSKPISCLSDIVDTNYFWKFWLYVVILILWMIFIHPTWFDVKWNSLIRNNFAPVFHARRYRYRRGLSQK
jgi:hypothetical protein